MKKNNEDKYFESYYHELAREKSRELNSAQSAPADEEAYLRFKSELDNALLKGKGARVTAQKRFAFYYVVAAICISIVLAVPLIAIATKGSLWELIKNPEIDHTEYRLSAPTESVADRKLAPTYVVEGFTLFRQAENRHWYYLNENGEQYSVDLFTPGTVLSVDTEGASVKSISIGEEYADLIEKKGYHSIIWAHEGYIVSIDGWLTEEQILQVANGIIVE